MRRLRGASAALALGVLVAGCDSLPESLGPTARELLSTFSIHNASPVPLVHVLVHPTTRAADCPAGGDTTYGGGVATFRTPTGQGRDINVPQGCYVFFLRWEGAPGHLQLRSNLGPDAYQSYTTPRTLPPTPAALPSDGSVRVINSADNHTAAITRIYTDACVSSNRYYGIGAEGGATTDNAVNVAHGQSVTIPLPRTCHMITILWSNGWYQFGTYNITGANSLTARG